VLSFLWHVCPLLWHVCVTVWHVATRHFFEGLKSSHKAPSHLHWFVTGVEIISE